MTYKKTKDHIFQSKHSTVRQMRMDNNRENKLLLEALHDTLAPKNSPRRIKDTVMLQILRLVQEDLYRSPFIMAKSLGGENEILSQTVDSICSRIKELGGYGKAIRKALTESTRREGTSYVMVVPNSIQDKSVKDGAYEDRLDFRYMSNASVYKDPLSTRIEDSDWFAVRYEYDHEEAQQIVKDMYEYKGKITPGDGIPIENREEDEGNDKDIVPDRTAIYEYWNRVDGVRVVIAGGNCEEILVSEGVDYPYLDQYGEYDFPIAQINATPHEYGGYAMSYVDTMKDVTEQCRRQFNQVLPYFDRVSNQLLAITGVTPLEDIASQIQDAEDYQEQGMVPFLSLSDPQARVTPVFPPDITAPMERIKSIFIEEMSGRIGLDLRTHQQQQGSSVPTATQVIERKQAHAKAVANINNINIPFYDRIHHIIINYARRVWDDDDKQEVYVNQGAVNEYVLPFGEAIKAVKKWRGSFKVDVSVELDLSRNEQVIVIQEIKKAFIDDLQIEALSEAEIRPLIDTMKAHIKLVGMDKYFQDAEVDAFYQAILEKGQMKMQQQIEQEQQKAQQEQAMFEQRKGATRSTPENQKQAARVGANAPQPV